MDDATLVSQPLLIPLYLPWHVLSLLSAGTSSQLDTTG